MHRHVIAVCLIVVHLVAGQQVGAEKTAEPDELGLTCIGEAYFPVPPGAEALDFPNGDLEEVTEGWPTGGWSVPDAEQIARTIAALSELKQRVPKPAEVAMEVGITAGEYDYIWRRVRGELIRSPWKGPSTEEGRIRIVDDRRSRSGKRHLHVPSGSTSLLRSPDFELRPNRPHLLSMWVRSNAAIDGGPWFWFDVGLEAISLSYHGLPDTGGEWRRVGIYFRAPPEVTRGHWTLNPGSEKNVFVELDDVRLRTATEAELAGAYAAWRTGQPDGAGQPRETNGRQLALSVAKLSGEAGIPGRPYRIWAVGSSWTSYLGNGETLRQIFRERFPDAPEIVYKKKVGSGTPYQYARGWVHNAIIADQPDLILTYTNGRPEDLELMLRDIRLRSTADVVVPSLHFMAREELDDETIEKPVWDEVREVCREYGAQFVDNRRELAAWLKESGRVPRDLLGDAVHQNKLGSLLINENISRHFTRSVSPGYDWREREMMIPIARTLDDGDGRLVASDGWIIEEGRVISDSEGQTIKLSFTGNRVELIGSKAPDGGSVEVFIDGRPAAECPVFFATYVRAAITNIGHMGRYPRSSEGSRDTGPQGVILGTDLRPEEWTIRMLDDEGNFELIGSLTKEDGRGNNRELFTSESGQIIIDPALWRHPQANRFGDEWSFEVYRTATERVDFRTDGKEPERFSATLVQNLENGPHTVEIRTAGDGQVSIDSFYLFRPALE